MAAYPLRRLSKAGGRCIATHSRDAADCYRRPDLIRWFIAASAEPGRWGVHRGRSVSFWLTSTMDTHDRRTSPNQNAATRLGPRIADTPQLGPRWCDHGSDSVAPCPDISARMTDPRSHERGRSRECTICARSRPGLSGGIASDRASLSAGFGCRGGEGWVMPGGCRLRAAVEATGGVCARCDGRLRAAAEATRGSARCGRGDERVSALRWPARCCRGGDDRTGSSAGCRRPPCCTRCGTGSSTCRRTRTGSPRPRTA